MQRLDATQHLENETEKAIFFLSCSRCFFTDELTKAENRFHLQIMHLICCPALCRRRRHSTAQRRFDGVGLYPSIWWTWILNANTKTDDYHECPNSKHTHFNFHGHSFSSHFFFFFHRALFRMPVSFCLIRFAFLFRPQISFVRKLNGNKSELCIFIRATAAAAAQKTHTPNENWAFEHTMDLNSFERFSVLVLETRNGCGGTKS